MSVSIGIAMADPPSRESYRFLLAQEAKKLPRPKKGLQSNNNNNVTASHENVE
jgi:hypothetical protein